MRQRTAIEIRVVVTSVGSLVGQNVLDSLDGRRAGIEVIGVNSAASAANNFRCDRAYLAPPAADEIPHLERLQAILILQGESPQLALAGRDDDVLTLARLKEMQPALAGALPVGPLELARVLDDKLASQHFARRHGLPVVDSVAADDPVQIRRLIALHGFPLIAKPPGGNGSRGVRIVFDDRQVAAFSARAGGLLQPYLEPEAELGDWRDLCRNDTPLFHAPPLPMIACQAIIGPDGRVLDLICTLVVLVMGRLESTWRIDDPQVADVAGCYAETFASAGWVGARNLQGRRDHGGAFQVFELNGRLTGGTAARLLLGCDEVGLLLDAFAGRRLPPRPSIGSDGIVTKSLAEFPLRPVDVAQLQSDGVWRRAPGTAAR